LLIFSVLVTVGLAVCRPTAHWSMAVEYLSWLL